MGTSVMPSGTTGAGRTWQGNTARGARVGLGAAAMVLLAGSTYAAMALDGAADDVAPNARLSAEAATPPQRAPQPAAPAPSPAAVAVPAAAAVDLGPAPDHASTTAVPVRHAASAGVTPGPARPAPPAPAAARPVVAPPSRAVGHTARPAPHDTTASDRFSARLRQQMRAEMRQEAGKFYAQHWHMPMTP